MATNDIDTIAADWTLAAAAPNQVADPAHLNNANLSWIPATVPGTVAQALQKAGQWDFDRPRDFDEHDWWYRGIFSHTPSDVPYVLRFDGLATLADAWLNGQRILTSSNMFVTHEVDVTTHLQEKNELVICFRSLNAALAQRRPRPRWKTKLVKHQQLRWLRTTLLGRIPGWSPPVAPVGPWRAIVLERVSPGTRRDVELRSYLEGSTGVVDFSCQIPSKKEIAVTARLSIGAMLTDLRVDRDNDGYRIAGQLRIDNVALWWPHTHGTPALHTGTARIVVDGKEHAIDCDPIGFRRVEARQQDGGFDLYVNGVPVFCRGACWTVNDIVSLAGARADLARALTLLKEAGGNMIRVGGTMVYEEDAFYRLCDELGILVWQDFMFANMDYPVDDEAFLKSIQDEATQQLKRLRRHPSVAVYCGNSEVEQQAAMLGMPRDCWRNRWFAEVLPALCERWHLNTPYVPSTPSGGTLPFHVGTGITHYYGVGAYLRPVSEVRRANVRFTSECLGFSNMPEQRIVDTLFDGEAPAIHDARWKQRTPRDTGAGWDFEDVRDHYFKVLFAREPSQLRYSDTKRYIELSRVATGEMMSQVYSEWRSAYSRCGGGLVWFYKDLWPGAGWGILDSTNGPKACFFYLRRVWQPQVVLLTDEVLDGVHAHVVNDTDRPLAATLEFTLLRDGHVVIAQTKTPCQVASRARVTIGSDTAFDGFYDASYAYRFGPPKHDVVAATLFDEQGQIISEAFHFPQAAEPKRCDAAIDAQARAVQPGVYELTLTSDRFLYAVHFDTKDFTADDNYFHLLPGRSKRVSIKSTATPGVLRGYVEALNVENAVPIVIKE